ncbi:MAG: hypothetical protein PHP29_07250 [Tissierellia bacterium]|nr:hypothetical protein [Tissierellia bacterium]
MKNIIIVFSIIILFVFSACEKKINQDVLSQPDDISQTEQLKEPEQAEQTEENHPHEQLNSNYQWPKDFIPKVPELEGEISSLIFDLPREGDEVQEPQYVRIELVNIEENAADEFIEGLKNGGFAQNPVYEKNEFHTKYYVQESTADYDYCRVLFKWNPIDKSALTVLLKPGFLALSTYLLFYEDTADEDLFPWPEGFLPNFPEPKGKIIDVCMTEVETEAAYGIRYDILFYYGDRQSVLDCIKEIKTTYYVDASEVITDNFTMYSGLSSYRDTDKYHSAYIGYEDISNSPYMTNLEVPEGKFRIINVSMYKDN